MDDYVSRLSCEVTAGSEGCCSRRVEKLENRTALVSHRDRPFTRLYYQNPPEDCSKEIIAPRKQCESMRLDSTGVSGELLACKHDADLVLEAASGKVCFNQEHTRRTAINGLRLDAKEARWPHWRSDRPGNNRQ